MSSHHIVREKQEPALFVLGMDDFPAEQLGQLLEWSPTVIATTDTAELLNSLGIKIDWIVTGNNEQPLQSDIVIIPDSKGGALDAVLNYLINLNYPAVNIITANFDAASYTKFVNQIDLVVFAKDRKIFAVHSGFSKWKPAGQLIEILSPASFTKTTRLEIVDKGVYRTTHDGFFQLWFDGPFLFIAEEL